VHDIFRAGSTVALLSSPEKQDESRWFSLSVVSIHGWGVAPLLSQKLDC
jgi:hypothetical protein